MGRGRGARQWCAGGRVTAATEGLGLKCPGLSVSRDSVTQDSPALARASVWSSKSLSCPG